MSKKGEYETGKSKALRVAIIGCFAVFTVFAMIASLLFGSADISFEVILHTLMGNVQTTDEMVIWNIRFPRNIVGALVGANLAVSGAILQAVMKNPLADPGIVGVSSGAGLAGVIMLIFMPEASLLLTPGFHRCDAFCGGGVCPCVEEWYPTKPYHSGRRCRQRISREWDFGAARLLLG